MKVWRFDSEVLALAFTRAWPGLYNVFRSVYGERPWFAQLVGCLALLLFAAPVYAQTLPVTQAVQIQVSWTDNSNNEDNFNLYRCQGSATAPVCVPVTKIASTGPDISQYTDTLLNDPGNTPLCYAVDASNSVGFSAKTPASCIRTAAIIVIKVAPGTPTGIRTSIVAIVLDALKNAVTIP